MRLFRQWRARHWAEAVRHSATAYAALSDRQARLRWQLARWNQEWARIRAHVPWYRRLAAEQGWPGEFESWEQVIETLPAQNRSFVQSHTPQLTSDERPAEFRRMTGGSTAQPVQLPAWNSELEPAECDVWHARSWYGVTPGSRLFLLWGHSHLLGQGWKGRWNGWKREWKDKVAGYCRFSAYDLSDDALRRAGDALLAFRPEYVIGYSVALDRFARVNEDRAAAFHRLGLRAVIAAAEAFPFADSEARLSQLLGCRVGMEYGSVETNLVGHTHPEGGYRVFWQSYFVEAPPDGPVRVTSLKPRAFPLVRYELGDVLELGEERNAHGIERFTRVRGRCHDAVALPDGRTVHSEVFTHVLRDLPGIEGYQVAGGGAAIELRLRAARGLAEYEPVLRERLGRVDPALARIRIRQVGELERTLAGKTPMILRAPEAEVAP